MLHTFPSPEEARNLLKEIPGLVTKLAGTLRAHGTMYQVPGKAFKTPSGSVFVVTSYLGDFNVYSIGPLGGRTPFHEWGLDLQIDFLAYHSMIADVYADTVTEMYAAAHKALLESNTVIF